MTQEEKAKRYDIALDKIKRLLGTGSSCSREELEYVFPELAESREDERIRKSLKDCFEWLRDDARWTDVYGSSFESVFDWLEKQRDKDKLIKELGEYKVKYTQEVLSQQLEKQCKQKQELLIKEKALKNSPFVEQKPVKVPKFKVGDFIQFKGIGHTRYTVKEVCGLSHYINTCNKRMDMSYTDANFELVEQKSAEWSEEDESILNEILKDLMVLKYRDTGEIGKAVYQKEIDWLKNRLKFLRPQSQWKPSYVQMEVLLSEVTALTEGCNKQIVLKSLYNDLKKLKD